jgi:hypothetical protein
MSKARVSRRRASASSLNPSPPNGIEATFEGQREHSREHSPRRPSLYGLIRIHGAPTTRAATNRKVGAGALRAEFEKVDARLWQLGAGWASVLVHFVADLGRHLIRKEIGRLPRNKTGCNDRDQIDVLHVVLAPSEFRHDMPAQLFLCEPLDVTDTLVPFNPEAPSHRRTTRTLAPVSPQIERLVSGPGGKVQTAHEARTPPPTPRVAPATSRKTGERPKGHPQAAHLQTYVANSKLPMGESAQPTANDPPIRPIEHLPGTERPGDGGQRSELRRPT